jgi:RHH-type rel operon transcriptional repressor/antitoxin RelB
MIALKLPAEIEQKLDAIATASGQTSQSLIEQAVLDYLEDLEDLELARQEVEDIKTGKSATISLADAMKRYGLGN